MKAADRKAIEALEGRIAQLIADAEPLRDEMREAADNLSEKAQEGDKGMAMIAVADALDEMVSSLESAQESANGAISEAETA